MPAEPLVSTIIPVHNRAAMILDAVASVLAQDHRPIEIIVVDDGSSHEETQALQRGLDGLADVRLLHQDNRGPGAARETGRGAARGAFIQYLDSDDVLLPGKFSAQLQALRAAPDCGVVYGMTRFRKADGSCVDCAWKGSGAQIDSMFPSFLVSRWWDTPNPLYRRELCDRAGPWMASFVEEDWEYDCRIAALGVKLAYVPAFVCEVRDHGAERLSRSGLEPRRLADRARAQARIYMHARSAGISADSPEMQHFARALFLLARQCGAAGLDVEAKSLFALARDASGAERAKGWDFRLYAFAAAILGWQRIGWLSAATDQFRR